MRKLLAFLGVIFALFLILAIIVIIGGRMLDRQSKAYADNAVVAIASTWQAQQLYDPVNGNIDAAAERLASKICRMTAFCCRLDNRR